MTPFITTYTGKMVNPLALRQEDVDVYDIAHALACCNRFAGHARFPISVAQHSVAVSLLVGDALGLAGLFHDASEAYLGDMTKWVKNSSDLEGFRAAESRAQTVIEEALFFRSCDQIGWADKLMVRYEYELSFEGSVGVQGYPDVTKGERRTLKDMLDPALWRPVMTWQEAEQSFLTRLRDLHRA